MPEGAGKLGTLDDEAAAWMRPVRRRAVTTEPVKLVIGANGFLGSHVTRQLVADGHDVRVMVRENANTIGIDDLEVHPVRRRHLGRRRPARGDDRMRRRLLLRRRHPWLAVATRPRCTAPTSRAPATCSTSPAAVHREHPLRQLRLHQQLRHGRPAPRARRHRGRRDHRRTRPHRLRALPGAGRAHWCWTAPATAGLPAVAMCVSTTYGAGDWGRTPHGAIIAGAAFGKLPFVLGGIELEAVGVDDAARAMILAAEHGRVGERYLISEKMISNAEVVRIAAEAAGVPAPTRTIPLPVAYAMAALGTAKARLTRQRRAPDPERAAADARRGPGRPQQGRAGTGLAAGAGRGVDPRGRPVVGAATRRQAALPRGVTHRECAQIAIPAEDVYAISMPRPAATRRRASVAGGECHLRSVSWKRLRR